MARNIPGSTDAHALRLIAAGRILCDPATGVILFDGVPRGVSHGTTGYQRVFAAGVYMQSHRVVWMFVNGPIPDGHVINHRDGNRRNNRIENLEVVTPRQNALHRWRSPNYRGEYLDHMRPDLSDVANMAERELSEMEELMQQDNVKTKQRIA